MPSLFQKAVSQLVELPEGVTVGKPTGITANLDYNAEQFAMIEELKRRAKPGMQFDIDTSGVTLTPQELAFVEQAKASRAQFEAAQVQKAQARAAEIQQASMFGGLGDNLPIWLGVGALGLMIVMSMVGKRGE